MHKEGIRSLEFVESVSALGGGLFDAVRNHAIALLGGGTVEPEVVGILDARSAEDRCQWGGVSVRAVPAARFLRRLGYSGELVRVGREAKSAIIHSHGLWSYHVIAAMKVARERRVPYVVSPHGMLDEWALQQGRWRKHVAFGLYQRSHLLSARCVRALCEAEAIAIRAAGYPGAIAVIPNGVTMPPPDVRPVPPWGSSGEGRKVLLYLGRLHPKKNLHALLRAWADVSRHARDWILAIVGWGEEPYVKELREVAPESTVVCQAVFGRAKWECLASANAFVMPSLSEGLPLGVLEAWASGLPVAMSAASNLGFAFDLDAAVEVDTDPRLMAGQLLQFLQFPEATLRAIGDAGRAVVGAKYSWPDIAERMTCLYGWVLGRSRIPDFMWRRS